MYLYKMGDYNKMKISELREVARSRGLKGWTALRKNDLMEFLVRSEASSSHVWTQELENGEIQNLPPPLKPTPYQQPRPIPKPRTKAILTKKFWRDWFLQILPPPLKPTPYQQPRPIPKPRTKAIASKKSWGNWLLSYVPEPIKSSVSRIKKQILKLYNNEPAEFKIKLSDSAFSNFTEKYVINGAPKVDATSFLKMVKELVVKKLQEKDNVKFRLVLVCIMEKLSPSEKKPEEKEANFSNKTTTKLVNDNVSEMYDEVSEKILEDLTRYQKEGSGWKLKRVLELEIHVVEYNPWVDLHTYHYLKN